MWGGRGGRGQMLLAKLHILQARKDLIGQEIPIYVHTITLGRNPKLVDIQLYDEDDNSTVSGQHCTLQYEKSRDAFLLTDHNSSAGTQVNGRPIQPNDPVALNDGDEIMLGEVFRRGAKLRFERVKSVEKPDAATSGLGVQKTILDDAWLAAPPGEGSNTIIDLGNDFGAEEQDKRTIMPDDDDWLSRLK